MPLPVDLIIDVPQGGLPESRLRWIQQYSRQYEGGPMQLQMSRPKRTPSQNRYYWGGVIGEIRQALVDMGQACSDKAIHNLMKERHLPVTVEYIMGIERVTLASTKKLDMTSFHDYVERVRNDELIPALGIYIKTPDEWQAEHGKFRSYSIAEPD